MPNTLRRAQQLVGAGLAHDATDYARTLGYSDPTPVIVMDGKVGHHRNRDYAAFCHQFLTALPATVGG